MRRLPAGGDEGVDPVVLDRRVGALPERVVQEIDDGLRLALGLRSV